MHVKLAQIANAHAMLATLQIKKVAKRSIPVESFRAGEWGWGVEKSFEDQCNIDANKK